MMHEMPIDWEKSFNLGMNLTNVPIVSLAIAGESVAGRRLLSNGQTVRTVFLKDCCEIGKLVTWQYCLTLSLRVSTVPANRQTIFLNILLTTHRYFLQPTRIIFCDNLRLTTHQKCSISYLNSPGVRLSKVWSNRLFDRTVVLERLFRTISKKKLQSLLLLPMGKSSYFSSSSCSLISLL